MASIKGGIQKRHTIPASHVSTTAERTGCNQSKQK